MTTVLADTFTAALGRLAGDEQKQAKLTVYDLQTEPDRPGLQFHRIDNSKDRNFWSVRVSRDIRIVVHKTPGSLLLAYVGHHDDAYRWAERRRIEAHPRTGALQIVELRERVEVIAAPVQESFGLGTPIPFSLAPAAGPARPLLRPFAALSADDLLSVGVPTDWTPDILAADEDRFLALATHLPAEAAEALLEFAATGNLRRPAPVPLETPAVEHPDARRRFRVLDNLAELEAALDEPWEKWSVFLHPDQRELVARRFAGPARVTGSAGTGKTVVALHRAMRIARDNPESRVLLTTFSEPLAALLQRKLRVLAGPDRQAIERVTVASFLGIAEELHQLVFARKAHLATAEIVRSLLARARAEGGEDLPGEQFLLSEWTNVIDAWQIDTVDAYAAVPRMGRRARLGTKQRAAVWPLFDRVREGLASRHLATEAALFGRMTRHFQTAPDKPFTHIVVDEAQDLGVAELRFLAAIAPATSDALFFAGDLGQRIFQQPLSWKGLGVDVRGRSVRLRVNYRTSHQIRAAADRLLATRISDVDGIEDDRTGTVSVFNGPNPTVLVADDENAEGEGAAAFIRRAIADGIEPGSIGIFVRSRDMLGRARAAAAKAGIETTELSGSSTTEASSRRVMIGQMHAAKGLEFRAVVIMACDEAVIPAQSRLAGVSDEMELDEVYATERHLLYVAATRARDRLLITAVTPPSEFLQDLASVTGQSR